MTIEAFLETAWNDHANRPQEVADRLTASLHLVQAPEHIPPYVRLLTHVFGEHLGQWDRGIALLESLRRLPAFDGGPVVVGAVARGVATLRYASGDSSALESLTVEDRVSALAGAASAFTGRNAFAQALAAYSEALRLGDAGLPSGSPAIRALAVGGNNLAAALEQKKDRDRVETRGMIAAAEAGLKYWRQAGTWLEEERAEYRLTRSLLQGGEHGAAIQSSLRCIEVCERSNAPAFEQFFGHAVLALAHRNAGDIGSFEVSRQRALQLLEQVPQEERQWCESDRSELGG
jgi:tetratricopeptide (TPR) repeat protein